MLCMKLLSSLHRVFLAHCPDYEMKTVSALANEPFSFQAAFKLEGAEIKSMMINVRSKSNLPLSTYIVGYVPVLHTDTIGMVDPPAPGLFPDMLLPKKTNPELSYEGSPWGKKYYEKGEETLINAANDSWQSVWFVINERREVMKVGKYCITIQMESTETREVLAEQSFEIEILPDALLPQSLMYTNWFHCDCLADYYNVEVFSDRFFKIFANYVHAAAINGMNMLLMPAFTPPLDTPINCERKTVQLVKVKSDNGHYSFDFSLMKRFIDIARKEGIEYFEHSHLFSQWGAKSAPKIMADVDGIERCIFGWDTETGGEEYKAFLQAYLPAVTRFLKAEGLADKTLFHISDEPSTGNEEAYCNAREIVKPFLKGFMVGDALSHYSYYEKGWVQTPICVTSNIHEFVGRCDNLWAYYTGGQVEDDLSNRVLVKAPEMNRILGTELYANRINGFLHWGYNYYYDMLSHGLFDPKMNAGGYNNHAGTCYSVYPGRKGEAIQSISQKVFAEGIDDMRALQTLEVKKGRAVCETIMKKHFGAVDFHVSLNSPEQMLSFREDVNKVISAPCQE